MQEAKISTKQIRDLLKETEDVEYGDNWLQLLYKCLNTIDKWAPPDLRWFNIILAEEHSYPTSPQGEEWDQMYSKDEEEAEEEESFEEEEGIEPYLWSDEDPISIEVPEDLLDSPPLLAFAKSFAVRNASQINEKASLRNQLTETILFLLLTQPQFINRIVECVKSKMESSSKEKTISQQ